MVGIAHYLVLSVLVNEQILTHTHTHTYICTDQTMYAVDIMRFHNFDMLNTYVEHSVHTV